MKNKVLVVDLDGTLFSINTFHYFLKFLILNCFKNVNVILFFKLSFILLLRGFKVISHAKMKYDVLVLIKNISDLNYNDFVNKIASNKRELSILKDTSFNIKILATAAPSCYAELIAKNENFDVCLSTIFPKIEFYKGFENIREVKKNNVLTYLASRGISEVNTFVTDHIDDLPLMKISKENILINPSKALEAELRKNLISFNVIR